MQLQQETLRIGQDEIDFEEERKQKSGHTEDSEEKTMMQKSVQAGDEKMVFPETTLQRIGWKPEVIQRNEVERHARGKQDIVKLFKWPREGV